MKKILIIANAKRNLEDDLFINTLVNRYKEAEFYICIKDKYQSKSLDAGNLKIIGSSTLVTLDENYKKTKIEEINCNKFLATYCDIAILLGGSIFLKGGNKLSNKFMNFANKIYIFKLRDRSLKYKRFHKSNKLRKVENESYKHFEEIKNTDIFVNMLFNMNISSIKKSNYDCVVISVLDLSQRHELSKYAEIYEKKLKETCDYFINDGYKITLICFSKYEGDEEAASRISNGNENIDIFKYDGNIEKTLNVIGKCKIVIATRPLAIILGLLLGKIVIPIIYTKKIIDILNNIDFNNKFGKLQDMNNFYIDEFDLNNTLDISDQINDATKQLKRLDLFLNG